jgi:multimeric flavodoxin WrbA
MNVCIVNGNPVREPDTLERYLDGLAEGLRARGSTVTKLDLRDLSIRHCTGCWGCWVRTPGECANRDDSAQVRRAVIRSDLAILASPVIMGFPSALLKKMQDKLIPLVHPYIELVHGEAHHRARYERYPRLGILLHESEDTDGEDIQIITGMYERMALNMKSRLVLAGTTADAVEEVADEISGL